MTRLSFRLSVLPVLLAVACGGTGSKTVGVRDAAPTLAGMSGGGAGTVRTNAGGTTGSAGGVVAASGGASGGTVGSSGGSNPTVLTVNATNGSSTFSGSIQDTLPVGGSGAVQLVVENGKLTLTGANTYSGATNISAGILQISGSNARLPTATAVVISGGTLDLNNYNQTVASLSGAAGTVDLGTGTLTVGDASGTAFSGTITGTGNVVKQGAGTLTLSGANAYTGKTIITAGAPASSMNARSK